jgi:predicted CoA-binding protein
VVVSQCLETDSPRRQQRHSSVAAAAGFVALGAYFGAVGLVSGWLSLGDRLNERLPFGSPVFGGLALLVLIAVPYTVLMRRAWHGDGATGATAIVAGAITVGWIAVQLAFLRELSVFHPVYAAIGVAFVVVGVRLRARRVPEVDVALVERFLAQPRIVMVGATDDPKKFGSSIVRALVEHGIEVVPVNPRRESVAGVPCVPDLRSVPGEVDAVLVMLSGPAAGAAVHECVLRAVPMVWLFRGAGAPGALSPAAVESCRANGIEVIAGACPLMFLGPVTGVHQAHLAVRRFAHAVG